MRFARISFSRSLIHAVVVLLPLVSSTLAGRAYHQSEDYESGKLGAAPHQSYEVSKLKPVAWNYVVSLNETSQKAVYDGYIFFSPKGVTMSGPLIFNQAGQMIWSGAHLGHSMAYSVVSYKGEDHIMVWQGVVTPDGHGLGKTLLINNRYEIVTEISTGGEIGQGMSDLHEASMSPNGTALVTAYVLVKMDLSSVGGPKRGYVLDGVFQEVDVETGEALFTWHSLDHVPLEETYQNIGHSGRAPGQSWDYFHINSVQKDHHGHYLVSSRNTHTVYYLDSDGEIIWRLGGKKSTFSIGRGCQFEWQHHARLHGSNQVSLFDNAGINGLRNEPTARGLTLDLDFERRTVSLHNQYLPYEQHIANSQGSAHIQDNGNAIIGWGVRPYLSEYDSQGRLLWAVKYGIGDQSSYRAYRFNWTARPSYKPDVTVRTSSADTRIYTSWNGATEVRKWQLFGSTADEPQEAIPLANATWEDFETEIVWSGERYAYYQVAGVNEHDQYLVFSSFVSEDASVHPPLDPAPSQVVTAPRAMSTSISANAHVVGCADPFNGSSECTGVTSSVGVGNSWVEDEDFDDEEDEDQEIDAFLASTIVVMLLMGMSALVVSLYVRRRQSHPDLSLYTQVDSADEEVSSLEFAMDPRRRDFDALGVHTMP